MTDFIAANQSVDRYIEEISAYPLLSREQERVLAQRYRDTGEVQAAHLLVVSNLRFVVKVAHEYRGYGLRLLDLIQEGNMGLMMAVKKFEPSKGYRLISYAVWWIRAYMQNFIMRSWSLVKLGTTQAQRKVFFKLRSARELADRANGERGAVSALVLAERLNVSEQDIMDMEMRLGARDFSLDMELQDGVRRTHLDMLAGPDDVANQEELYAANEEEELLRGRVHEAMEWFNEKERYIVLNRLMTDEPKTLQEIGKHFRISRERARQIEGNVIRKIRTALSGTGLEPSAA